MNTMVNNVVNLLLSYKKHIIAVCLLIVAILLISSTIPFFSLGTSSPNIVSGRVYIDDQPASNGINVSFIFAQGIIFDKDGTNESGMFEIDVSDFKGQSFNIYVYIDGKSFIGMDETGSILNITLNDTMNRVFDVYIDTLNNSDSSDTDSGNSNDDFDGSGSDTTDEESDENSDNDTTNEEDGNTGDDATNDDGSDSSENDDSDDTDDNDSNDNNNDNDNESDDNPSDEENQENEFLYLSVKKTVWDPENLSWSDSLIVDLDQIVHFNITIVYNCSNETTLSIVDMVSDGLYYNEGAVIDGIEIEPSSNELPQTLIWNVSTIANQNTSVNLLYNTTVHKRNTLHNNVTVYLIQNNESIIKKHSDVTFEVFGELLVSNQVKHATSDEWDDTLMMDVGETIRVNISVDYNGSHSIFNMSIMDKLPDGLRYMGNATFNEDVILPFVSSDNMTVCWNISVFQPNDNCFFEFDINVTKNATLFNKVTIMGMESLGKQFSITKSTTITGKAMPFFICKKSVKVENSSWQDSINAFVNDIATFQVEIINYQMPSIYNIAIIDTLPSSLAYIPGSAIFYCNNMTLSREPIYNEDTNQYFWVEVNKAQFSPNETGYFTINDTIILEFEVIILEEGIATNIVNVNSSACGSGCDPLSGSDSASINATNPIEQLVVDIVAPDIIYVDDVVEIHSLISGGIPPYSCAWDIDNDSDFDDAFSKDILMQWENPGLYPISIKVQDNASTSIIDRVNISVDYEPLQVNAGGPYFGNPKELIQFKGSAVGGFGNYSWFWDFDNGNVSTIQNPLQAFSTILQYDVTLTVTDERNMTSIDTSIVYIEEPDSQPPIIYMHDPFDAIYIKNNAFIPFFTPLILGSIDVNISAEDNDSSIEKIELYINNLLVETSLDDSLLYEWNEMVFGKQSLIIKAFDVNGNWDMIEKTVWKFF